MAVGVKHVDSDIIYTVFKKHFCPNCGAKRSCAKVSKVINSKSTEAADFDFSSGEPYMAGDVKFIRKEFYCPRCDKRFAIKELKQIEKPKSNISRD